MEQTRTRQQLKESKRKRQEHGNSNDDGVDNSSNLTSSTAPCLLATLTMEHLQAVGITQSQIAQLGKKKAKLTDHIASMHLKRVTEKQSIIAKQKCYCCRQSKQTRIVST